MKKLINMLCVAILLTSFISDVNAEDGKGISVVAVSGKVIDANTRNFASVKVIMYDELGNKIGSSKSNAHDGYYYITKLTAGRKYSMLISDEKYLAYKIKITIPETEAYKNFSKDILVFPAEGAASKIKLPVPPFRSGTAEMRYGYAELMETYLSLLTSNQTKKVEIECYPDNDTDTVMNIEMTEKRAAAISNFLVINDIDLNRISTKGNNNVDPNNPPPKEKASKGKRYVGSTYLIIK